MQVMSNFKNAQSIPKHKIVIFRLYPSKKNYQKTTTKKHKKCLQEGDPLKAILHCTLPSVNLYNTEVESKTFLK
jgi:hypothetical protein